MIIYHKLLFYKGLFYIEKKKIKTSYTHNRLKNTEYIFIPNDINSIEINEEPINFEYNIILLDHFHYNPAHNMWDHLYPSWYGLFKYLNNDSKKIDFQYIVKKNIDKIFGIDHINMIEIFSGKKPITLDEFSNKYNKPIIIPYLITGLENIGISHINKNNLTVKKGLVINKNDPIETFVNRIYYKYNIKRNSLLTDLNKCNNIIFIKNKRQYNGIEELFKKLNDKYLYKYNFKIINYENFNFEEQLNILNTTCICIVGVGSARFNTPFLPNGAIEIQIFQPNINKPNFIEYLDYHGGTLSNYIKIFNIPYYTEEEAKELKYSNLLEEYINNAVNNIPCKVPVNLEENIPIEIKNLKNNKNYSKMFDIWRNNLSNIVEDFFNLL